MSTKSEYQVIARKWRPRKFSEVVGQEHIIKTLQNELVLRRTAHAYLFVGARGIGKTTIARIFAKALNCKNLKSGEPCCSCESCVSITDGSSLDVIEIDAASNNSVDNARNLCDEVLYTPVNSPYKIYIIDEVHMLSTQAWNALLKTVEEPPAHVKFLFATTEAHKVIPTIVSRCQRFDLRRIPSSLIAGHLQKIAETENVKISRSAIEAAARAADGGMRDAQSILDQMISFFSSSGYEISEEQVLSVFGLAGASDMEKIIQSMLLDDKAAVIAGIHSLANTGKNLEKLFEDILCCLRGIYICKITSDPQKILETGSETIEKLRELGKSADDAKLQRLLENLSPAGRLLRDALNKQVFLETSILKAMRISHAVQIGELIAKLNQMGSGGEENELPQAPCSSAHETGKIEDEKKNSRSFHAQIQPESGVKIKEEKTSYNRQNDVLNPEILWHSLISDMDNLNKPLLKAYMQKGIPESWVDGVLAVTYDQEFEDIHVNSLKKEITALNNCLRRLTGNRNSTVKIQTRDGISSPHEITHKNEKKNYEIMAAVEKNNFVRKVMQLFDGEIVDVRG